MAQFINERASRFEADVVLPTDFDVLFALAAITPMLQVRTFPMSCLDTLKMYHDKATFMKLARENGCPTPDFVRIETKADLCHKELSDRFGLPYVVKPSGAANSNGVVYVDKIETLDNAIKRNAYYTYSNLIASRYVDGIDVGASVFALDGNVIASICLKRHGPSIEFFENETLISYCARMVKCKNFTGVADFELGWKIAENFICSNAIRVFGLHCSLRPSLEWILSRSASLTYLGAMSRRLETFLVVG